MHNFLRFFTFLIALSLIGCGATLPTVKSYKMDIQQGNVVTSEMLLKLRPGMTKSQVKFIMGTPLLVDSFRTNRWDYFYQLRKRGSVVSQRRVILDFEDDLLKRVRGDVVPKGKTAEDLTQELEQKAKKEGDVEESPANAEPVVKPIEAPAIELKENASAAALAEEPAEDADSSTPASVLAVPVGAAAIADVSPPESAANLKEISSQQEAVSEEAESQVKKLVPANEVAPIAPASSEPEAELRVDSASASQADKEVLTVMPSKADSKLIFRMDRSLNVTRIVPQEVTTSDLPLQDSVVQEVEDVANTLPAEDPSFFERMLEKIGF